MISARRFRLGAAVGLLLSVAVPVLSVEPAGATAGISAVWNAPGQTFSPGDPVVALTFDDGPNPTYTPQILDILDRYVVPATFFVLGAQGSRHPELIGAEAQAGDAVGNHTWDHIDLTATPSANYSHEVDDVSTLIEQTTGHRPTCLRAPGGHVDDNVIAHVADHGMATVGWDVDARDWERPGADVITRRVLSSVRPGSIIGLHDGGGDRSQTVAALPGIIDGLRARGLTPVSICTPPVPLPPPPPRLETAEWFLREYPTSGAADISFTYGSPGDLPIVGDWDGDGIDTPGVVRDGQFFLRNSNTSGNADVTFTYGSPGDTVVVGDWDGDGADSVGVVRGTEVFLRNSNTSGPADVTFAYGDPGDHLVFGKWQAGAQADTVGVVRGATFLLRRSNTPGVSETEFVYGDPGDLFEIGDWNGDGVDTPAARRGALYYVRNSNSSGPADDGFLYGEPGDLFPLVGRWSPDTAAGVQGPGVAR